MFESIRKAMYFGLGAAAMSWDKIRQGVDELVEKGDITAEEGRKLYEDLTTNAEEQGRAFDERVRSQVRQMLADMGVATRSEVAALQTRIDILERRISDLSLEQARLEQEQAAHAEG